MGSEIRRFGGRRGGTNHAYDHIGCTNAFQWGLGFGCLLVAIFLWLFACDYVLFVFRLCLCVLLNMCVCAAARVLVVCFAGSLFEHVSGCGRMPHQFAIPNSS